jgi:AI-2 transport protein TqsA
VLAVALPGAIEFIIGNLVQPKVQGGSLQLHPVVVLMSLIFFGMIWGIVGAFLATPIAGAIKIIFERIEMTRPLAEIMSGDLSGVGRRFETNAAKEALIEMEEERAGV